MNGKLTDGNLAMLRWVPIVVASLTAGVVTGQAVQQMSLVSAVGVAVIAGLAVGAGVHVILRLALRNRTK